MTIKKQFILLAISIISIPLLCIVYLSIDKYHKSEQRVLIKGYNGIHKMESELLSDEAWQRLFDCIKDLPPNVQTAVIIDHNKVLISTIPELPANNNFSHKQLWSLIERDPYSFLYQYTSLPIVDADLTLISRIPRIQQPPNKRYNVFVSLVIFLCCLVVLLVVYVLLIFRSIINSITKIKDKTRSIAEGNLSEPIEIEQSKNGAANEIISITESLETMRLSLIELQQRKNKFVMGMSHDLRTPVAIIKGYTEALKDGIITEPDEIQNTLGLISEKTNKLEDMINILINYTKLNTSEIRNQLTPHSITSLIQEFGKDAVVTGQIFKRNVTSEIKLDEEILVPMDVQLVSRAFENILSNAIRYTKENDSIEVISFKDENNVILKIKDTGCGIDEKDLNNIFDLFYRATNSRQEEGMGIGLSVVKNIIDTHGWKISVESEKDKGSCFTITIPYKKNLTADPLQKKENRSETKALLN